MEDSPIIVSKEVVENINIPTFTESFIKKDIVGEFIFNLRLLNKDRLFGIITGFCDIKQIDDNIIITSNDVATNTEINKTDNLELINSIIKKIDNNLNLKIEYNEKENKKVNILEILKQEFKNILKVKEK